MAQKLNTKELAKKVRGRRKFLDKVIGEIITLVNTKGKTVSRMVHSARKYIVLELRNFGAFTFHTDWGQTMFGGNTVKVYYHPGRNFREGGLDSAFDKDWTPVLDVDFQVDGEYRVNKFDEKLSWQKKLVWVLRNKDRIAAPATQNRQKQSERAQAAEIKRQKETRVRQDAENLGITVQ